MLSLAGFYALLGLSTGGIQSFGVGVLTDGYAVPLATANWALSAFLTLSALGVLAGGFVADRARRHGEVAAIGFGLCGVFVLLIATVPMGAGMLILAMGAAGFCSGIIAPSRDMMVRNAAPPGATGRAFGIVSTGFNVSGTLGPLMFGLIMDHGQPRWVFGVSVVVMAVTVVSVLVGERRQIKRSA
jgi:FSR family fosmidomycin resistance protein-like MFS transporter